MAEKILNRIKKGLTMEKPVTNEEASAVVIDYPREGDLLLSGHYAVRITSAHDNQVQISINNGDWQDTRAAGGFFWFDWWLSKPGKYTLVARAKKGKATPKKSANRNCTVVASK